jgi:hypothetical protein
MSRPAQVDGRRALEDAARREAEAFRPNTRPLLIAIAVNAVIAVLLLGLPYYRGQRLAQGSVQAFAVFGSCAIGGKPEPQPGLALPPDERSHFADKVLHERADWPGRCAASLRAVAPEQAIFLWPSVKRAGADVSAAADLVERELSALERARKQGVTRIPERPLLAIGKLRAALTLLARAASVSDTLDQPAIRFERESPTAIEPTRLPIMAAETAAMDMWLRNGGIEALALDIRGLSWLALDRGEVDRTRVKRSSLLRGTVRVAAPAGYETYGVFAMPEERCASDEHKCARRATGVASITRDALFAADARNPLSPQWLAAHPAERFDRSVRIDPLHIEVLALADATGALALRRFARVEAEPEPALQPAAEPAAPASGAETERAPPRPSAALETWPLTADTAQPFDITFVPEQGALNVALARAIETGVEASLIDPRSATPSALVLGTAAGGKPFITRCRDVAPSSSLERSWLAFGSNAELALVRVASANGQAPALTPLARAVVTVRDPIHAIDPERDHVIVRCDGGSAALLALTAKSELIALLCEDERCEQKAIASDVATFAGVLARNQQGAQLVLALSRKGDLSTAVTTWRLGDEPSAPRTLSGCWEPAAGMCGAPALAADGAQVVLAARERGDLRVLESQDAGTTFRPRPDMVAETTTNLAAPLDQHRMRKGLEK